MAYGTTERYLKNNPNTDASFTKKAIAKYTKTDDPQLIDETYDHYVPYWAMSLAVQREAIRAGLSYLDEKEFAQARMPSPENVSTTHSSTILSARVISQKSALGNRNEVLSENVREGEKGTRTFYLS